MAEPLAAPRNSQPISDAVQYTVPECRDMPIQMPESTCSFNTFPVQPTDNSRNTDGATMHNKGYSIPPPHHVPSNQFSFVNGEHQMKSRREVPPPPSYSNGHHFMPSMMREYGYDSHERSRPPYDYQERWNVPPPCSGKTDNWCFWILIFEVKGFALVVCINYYLSWDFCFQVLGIVTEVCLLLMVVILVNQLVFQVMDGDFLPHQWITGTPCLLDPTLKMQFQ